MLAQMTIGKRLGISVGSLLVLIVILGLASWNAVNQVSMRLNKIVSNTAVVIDQVQGSGKRLQEAMSDARGAALAYTNDDEKAGAANVKKLQAANVRMGEMIQTATPLLSPEGKKHMDAVVKDIAQIQPLQAEYIALSKDHKPADANTLMQNKITPLLTDVEAESLTIVKVNRADLANFAHDAAAIETRGHWTIAGILLIALLVGVVAVIVVQGIRSELADAMGGLSEGAEQINNAASQVATSSQSLAQGASEQAASIEETSASSEEINSMSRRNADSSGSVAQLAQDAEKMFAETEQQLDEMVVSMAEIHASSGKISKIIKEIDAIAFQTNILALNAAVEAARAGDSGMGFAVVAEEVRNLAQRSATAAADTAALIEESIAKSNAGQGKVDVVAESIRKITGNAGKMRHMAIEVKAGSEEQSVGMSQIGRAITQMEQLTQATAASAEQSAATAQQLNAQSMSMREIVGRVNRMVTG